MRHKVKIKYLQQPVVSPKKKFVDNQRHLLDASSLLEGSEGENSHEDHFYSMHEAKKLQFLIEGEHADSISSNMFAQAKN